MTAFICRGHTHLGVRDAMSCLLPDGGSFIRANEARAFPALFTIRELNRFFSKRCKRWAEVGEIKLKEAWAVPLTVNASQEPPWKRGERRLFAFFHKPTTETRRRADLRLPTSGSGPIPQTFTSEAEAGHMQGHTADLKVCSTPW